MHEITEGLQSTINSKVSQFYCDLFSNMLLGRFFIFKYMCLLFKCKILTRGPAPNSVIDGGTDG